MKVRELIEELKLAAGTSDDLPVYLEDEAEVEITEVELLGAERGLPRRLVLR